MKYHIEARAIQLGEHIVSTKQTVRETAKLFSVSKSTVHKDVSERLKHINTFLYDEVKEVMDFNMSERHIRGGLATKNKYLGDSD